MADETSLFRAMEAIANCLKALRRIFDAGKPRLGVGPNPWNIDRDPARVTETLADALPALNEAWGVLAGCYDEAFSELVAAYRRKGERGISFTAFGRTSSFALSVAYNQLEADVEKVRYLGQYAAAVPDGRKILDLLDDVADPNGPDWQNLEAQLGLDAGFALLPQQPGGGGEAADNGSLPKATGGQEVDKEALALAILAQHPDLSDTEIASRAGCNRTSLYRWLKYVQAREILEQGKHNMPSGAKDKDGRLEAWDS